MDEADDADWRWRAHGWPLSGRKPALPAARARRLPLSVRNAGRSHHWTVPGRAVPGGALSRCQPPMGIDGLWVRGRSRNVRRQPVPDYGESVDDDARDGTMTIPMSSVGDGRRTKGTDQAPRTKH